MIWAYEVNTSVWNQTIPLPFLAPSFVAQYFTESQLNPATNSDSPWKEMWIYDRKCFSLCIVYICGALTHDNLTAAARALVTTWPEGLRLCSSRLTACSGWISPSAPLFHKEPADLVCPECLLGAAQTGILSGRSLWYETPAGKTL